MTDSRSLVHKRILITDVENEFGRELYIALRGEGCMLFTFVKELCRLAQVMNEFPDVLPILLDPSNAKKDESHKLLSSFPCLDHIVNLSGEPGLDIISRAWGHWKIHDFGENKTKPLISKMKDAGSSKSLIFHSSAGNHNLMSKLKANLNPRYTDSATAQVSTSVRKSIRKLFSGSSSTTPSEVTPTTSNGALAQSITLGNNRATEFATLAESLSQAGGKKIVNKESPCPSSTPSPRATPTPNNILTPDKSSSSKGVVKTVSEKNEKIRSAVTKINMKALTKWGQLLKDMEKEQLSHLKQLDKNLNALKKKEKASLMTQNADANAATVARSNVLSVDTTSRIMASREARVDREVEKKVEARRDADTRKIAEDKKARMEELIDKLYHKTITKQIAEFNRIKQKYFV